MKKRILFLALSISMNVFAADEPKIAVPPTPAPKVTVKDAKKTCKEEGRDGADLLKCIKEKKGTE